MTVSGSGRAVVSPYHGSAHPSPCLTLRHGLGATVAVSHHHQPERPTMSTLYRTPSTLSDSDRRRIDILFDLLSAHTTLVDPDDRRGARWVVAEAVRLAKQYGFDDPETVGDLLAQGIL